MTSTHIKNLADGLKKSGIRFAFGVTGSGPSLDLINHLMLKKISYVPVANEASAALMAGGACADGVPRAIAISIKGPGFANLFPGIVSNYYENRPVLTVSEAYASSAPAHRRHKRLNHTAAIKQLVKAYGRADERGNVARQFLKIARAEVPGPVHLDISDEPAREKITVLKDQKGKNRGTFAELMQDIKKANRPVCIAGAFAARRLENKINYLRVPVLTTATAKGAYDETLPYAAGVITGEAANLSPESNILTEADCIVGIGLRNTEVVKAVDYQKPLWIIDEAGGLSEGFGARGVLISHTVGAAFSRITVALNKKEWGTELVANYRMKLKRALPDHGWLPAGVFNFLESRYGGRATLVLDTGFFCTVGETVWRAHSPLDFIGSSNGRFMGTSIPTALGFSISHPRRPVVCVFGDGGARPYLAEIKLAVSHRLLILFVFMSDSGYGSIGFYGKTKSTNNTPYKIRDSSWWQSVAAMGCPARVIRNLDGLAEAVKKWDKNRGPIFLEMHFDPKKYAQSAVSLRSL